MFIPRLAAVAGPLKGSVFALAEAETSIGRDPSNQIAVLDGSVSRRHCVIRKEAQRFTLADLESRNGTFVNAVPIRERALEDGDEIKIGNSLFIAVLSAAASGVEPSSSVEMEERELAGASTIELRMEDALFTAAGERAERDLNSLLRVSRALNSVCGLEQLERQLLESMFEVVPAERGAILLAGERPGEFVSMFGWDRQKGAERPLRVSRQIIDRALKEGVAILSNDISTVEPAPAAGERPIRSVLAVPLEAFSQIRGVIYMDSSDPLVRFDEELLRLLAAIGAIGALALEHARRLAWLESEHRRLQAEVNIDSNMIGESQRMREVHELITRVGTADSTVLICGESGTGKELAARAIHSSSPRASRPFVAINCAALADTLLESDLFGHEKGAFTGAVAQKKGRLEVADGGSVFLDEVAELAPVIQAKLLRVLQEHEFERVGGTRPLRVNIRVIAATNRDLKELVERGAFRADLYHRLNVISLKMPPLRERREDIPLLASYFAAKFSAKCGRQVMGVSRQARSCLVEYDWPGNVRELENAIEHAVVLGSSDLILPEDLPEALLEKADRSILSEGGYHTAVRETKREIILRAIEEAGGNLTAAANRLGLQRTYLHRLMRNLDLKPLKRD